MHVQAQVVLLMSWRNCQFSFHLQIFPCFSPILGLKWVPLPSEVNLFECMRSCTEGVPKIVQIEVYARW